MLYLYHINSKAKKRLFSASTTTELELENPNETKFSLFPSLRSPKVIYLFVFAICLITSSLLFVSIKSLIGLRVSEEDEIIKEFSKKIDLRYTPKLKFRTDSQRNKSFRLDELINNLSKN